MHEFTAVKHVVEGLCDRLEDQHPRKVISVCVRCGTTIAEEALVEAFSGLAVGTILEGADLTVETVYIDAHCLCGHEQTVTHRDMSDGVYVCPRCARSYAIDESVELEVVNVIMEEETADEMDEQVSLTGSCL